MADPPQGTPRAEVEAALARVAAAAKALSARPSRERIAATGAALEVLRDPGSRARARLARELPKAAGFSPAVVERGLTLALEPWTAERWQALAESELGPQPDALAACRTTAVVLAGALPTSSLLQLLAPLALGSGVVAKPAAADPATPAVVGELLAELDPDLAAAFETVRFDRADVESSEALCQAECVVVTGGDEAVRVIAERTPPGRHLVVSGHRFSVGVLGAGALAGPALAEAAAGFALDTALWDQLGCLSPVALFVLGVDRVPGEVVQALADAFERIEGELPRGRVPVAARAATAQARDEAELRLEGGSVLRLPASTLVIEADAKLRPSPLHRFLRVQPVPDPEALRRALAPYASHLAGVSTAGLGEGSSLPAELQSLGASRLCPAGTIQAPPLSWRRESRPILRSLLLS